MTKCLDFGHKTKTRGTLEMHFLKKGKYPDTSFALYVVVNIHYMAKSLWTRNYHSYTL